MGCVLTKTSYAKVLQLPGLTIRPLCQKCPYLCKFTSNYTKPHEIFKFEFSTWMWLHLLSPTSSWWFYIEFSIFYEFYSFSVIFHRKKINKHLQLSEKSETPQAHIPTLHDHSQKFSAQSESLKWSLLEKEPFTHMSVHPWVDPTNMRFHKCFQTKSHSDEQ